MAVKLRLMRMGKKKQPTAAEERALFRELSHARETRAKLDKRAEAEERGLRRGKIPDNAREATVQRATELRRASEKLTKRIAELEADVDRLGELLDPTTMTRSDSRAIFFTAT